MFQVTYIYTLDKKSDNNDLVQGIYEITICKGLPLPLVVV